jgi:TonB family protein
MNAVSAEPQPDGLAETKSPGDGSWTRNWWLTFVALVFVAHLLLLFAFGWRKQIVPRVATNVPTLNLANDSSEWLTLWLALNDPTLFALPHQKDFASALWLPMHALPPPSFRWTESPRWLPLSTNVLGLAFNQFMQTNRFTNDVYQLKPPVKLSAPGLPIESVFAQNSAPQIQDDLTQRRLLAPVDLPSWPYADVLAPSVVQAVVDEAGNVISTVLLSPSGYDAADQRALELARAARFAPASRLTVGRMIFNWRTAPPPPSRDSGTPAASP